MSAGGVQIGSVGGGCDGGNITRAVGMWEVYTLAAISGGGMSNYRFMRGKYVTVGPVIYGVSMFIELIYNFVFIHINIYSIEMYY